MTTIAYRNGVLAADTRVSGGIVLWGNTSKIAKSPKGDIGGCSGNLDDIHDFLNWIKDGCDGNPPKPDCKDVDGILIRHTGVVYVYGGKGILSPYIARFYAFGSGAEIAMGAMAMGADAKKAVQIAMTIDVKTGGKVQTITHPKFAIKK